MQPPTLILMRFRLEKDSLFHIGVSAAHDSLANVLQTVFGVVGRDMDMGCAIPRIVNAVSERHLFCVSFG